MTGFGDQKNEHSCYARADNSSDAPEPSPAIVTRYVSAPNRGYHDDLSAERPEVERKARYELVC